MTYGNSDCSQEWLRHLPASSPIPQGDRRLSGDPGVAEPLHVPCQAGQYQGGAEEEPGENKELWG